jgi:hypothetical protein
MAKNVGLGDNIGSSFERIANAEEAKSSTKQKNIQTKSKKTENIEDESMIYENSKSDLMRVTITLPDNMLEALEKISWSRRKAKQPYSISHIIRESITAYLTKGN